MSPPPRIWIRPELDYLVEVYTLLGKNDNEIARLTKQLEELLALLERSEALRPAIEIRPPDDTPDATGK
jgi:hypothetical protein